MTALEEYYKNKKATTDKAKLAEELLGEAVKEKSPGFFMKLLDILDRPGNAVRALLVGKLGGLKGLIPFAQTIENLTGIDIALNKDERVAGTDVLDKLFGLKHVKGKFDPVDVLGFIVEVATDPLIYLGGVGTTKLGAAAGKLRGARQAVTAAKLAGKSDEASALIKGMKAAFEAAKKGTPITDDINKGLVKAFTTTLKSNSGKLPKDIFRAKTWAEQAAKGEKGILLAGLPGHQTAVVKGEKVWGALDKAATKIRMGPLGAKFLNVSHRVPTEYQDEFHNIVTKHSRNLKVYNAEQAKVKISQMYERAVKAGVDPKDLTDYIEMKYSDEPIQELIDAAITKRKTIVAKRIDKKQVQMKGLLKEKDKLIQQDKDLLAKQKLTGERIIQGEEKQVDKLVGVKSRAQGRLKRIGKAKDKPLGGIDRKTALAMKGDPDEILRPNLYIGNVTERSKKEIAESIFKNPDDVRGFTDWAARKGTKRSPIELTRKNAFEYLDWLEKDMANRLDNGLIKTHPDMAKLNADWGDVKALRESLGLPKKKAPYKVVHEQGEAFITINKTRQRIEGAVTPSKLQESGLSTQEVLQQAMRKSQRDTRVAHKVGKLEQKVETASQEITKKLESIAAKRSVAPEELAKAGRYAGQRREVSKQATDIANQITKVNEQLDRFRKFPNRFSKKIEVLQTRKQRLSDLADDIAQRSPGVEESAKEFKEFGDTMLQAEQARGVPVASLKAGIGYQHRSITKEFREWIDKNQHFNYKVKDFSTYSGSQNKRIKQLEGLTRDEVDTLFKDLGYKGGHVYEADAATAGIIRSSQSAKVIGSSDTILNVINNRSFVTKVPDDIGEWSKVTDLIESSGLKLPKKKYEGLYIPKEIYNALTETHTLAFKDEFGSAWKQVNSFLKGSMTMYWPAYHGRNAVSNVFLNWIAGVKNPKSYATAVKLQRAAAKTRKIMASEGIDWVTAASKVDWPSVNTIEGMMPGYQFYDLANQNGILGRSSYQHAVEEMPIVFKKNQTLGEKILTHNNPVSNKAKSVAMAVEDNARLAHVVEQASKGMDMQTAATSAKKVLFDYGDLSEFEKNTLRDKVFLFYTFARKNLPLQVKTLVQQPGKQAFYAHLAGGTPRAGGEGQYLKEYEQERLNVPTPFYDEEQNQYVIRGTGMPIEEAFGPLSGAGFGVGRFQRIGSQALSRLNPALKAPIEFTTGKDLYFNSPIYDWQRWATNQLPLVGRGAGTLASIRNPNEPVGSKITGFATGLRYSPFDLEEQKRKTAKEIARKDKRFRRLANY